MYKRILVPMALDHGISPETLEIAHALCEDGGTILALHVYEMPPSSVSAYLDEDLVKQGFANAKDRLQEKVADLPDVSARILTGHPARTIIDFAKDEGVDCIVMGSHKPDLSDYFLGSTASRVVRHAPCAVHVRRSPV